MEVSKEEEKLDHTGEERTRSWGEQQLNCHTSTWNSHTPTCIAHTHQRECVVYWYSI